MKPCPTSTANCDCSDNPLGNFSAEAPDQDVFLGFNSGWGTTNGPNPGQGGGPGFNFCESTIDQFEADLCAADCQVSRDPNCGSGGGGGGGGGGSGGGDGGGGSPTLFYNNAQTCSVICPDGSPFAYTIRANQIRSYSQELSDRIANSLACLRANAQKVCLPTIDGQACLGDEYEQEISLQSTVPQPIDWQIVSGMLPPGVTLEFDLINTRNVSLEGTPTLAGNFTFALKATDNNLNSMVKTYTISVLGITNTPSAAAVGAAYSFQFIALGGTAPYTFSVPPGHLPTGLSMSESGLITGTPTEDTPTTFTVTLEDSLGQSCQVPFTITPVEISLSAYWTFDKVSEPILLPADSTQRYFTDQISNMKLLFGRGLQWNGYTDGLIPFGEPGFFTDAPAWDGKMPGVGGRGNGAFTPVPIGFPSINSVDASAIIPGRAGLSEGAASGLPGNQWGLGVHTTTGSGGQQWGAISSDPTAAGTYISNSGPPATATLSAYDVATYPAGRIGLGIKLPYGSNTGNGVSELSTDNGTSISFASTSPGISAFGWFKMDGTSSGNLTSSLFLLEMGDFNAVRFEMFFDASTNTFTLSLRDQAFVTTSVASVVAVADNSWCFFAGTYNQATKKIRLYVNNNAAVEATCPTALTSQTHGKFGSTQGRSEAADRDSGQFVPLLVIDEIGFGTAKLLTSAQVLALYNGGNGLTWPAVNSV